jgi:hypothetical protein
LPVFKLRDLWNTIPSNLYDIAYNFGRTGMTCHCFDTLHANIWYSHQLENRPVGMSSECYRWTLVDDFVTNFNNHRASQFYPSHLICIDESMSHWYGQGGEWINHGLPFYVAIERLRNPVRLLWQKWSHDAAASREVG